MIVSFSKLGSMGRLGNQLFQVAATKKIAEDNGAQASFPAWKYENVFDIEVPHHGMPINTVTLKEKNFHYEPVNIDRDTDLLGYYQSTKYFPKDFKIGFKQHIVDKWKNFEAFERETIAIQIRRGDYVANPIYYQLPITWFLSALISIPDWQKKNIIIVSDDPAYVKVHFECLPNAYYSDKWDEIDQLCLLSLCDYHIIANSTFGWWGAYMAGSKHVIHSGKLFSGAYADKDISDFYPPNWILHEPDKLDLKDVTFTVPLKYDHPDRKKNWDLSLCILQKNFETNVICGEQGKQQFQYLAQFCRYHYFEGMEHFHRTKMLNDLALMADTDIIVNWDCDIFIPPLQVWLAVERIRSGAGCVYPYDGRFARMDRLHWFKKLETLLDIGITGTYPLFQRNVMGSVGGAVFWRKETFIDAGMENENMISYAPEDVERWERMHKLGFHVERITGTLYHMNHFKGPDSHNGNPHFQDSKKLLESYRQMTPDQLRHEVDGWKWRHKYTEAYYARISESAIQSAKEVYTRIFDGYYTGEVWYNKLSVIDIGCGVGEWSCGNPDYEGVDFKISLKSLIIHEDQYIELDLETAQGLYTGLCGKVDLCICLEVAEHISEGRADWLVKELCSLSDMVLFSAAIPNQGGTGHINEQWQEYWAEKFYANGFGAELLYPVKDNKNIDLWYRQNMILYKRGAKGKVTNFVLPEYYEQITNALKAR